ncbi:MAG: tyrosine-type recombinase/integrase [Candidatus Adiutrix sp.]|jgi:integrase|nr:tyrosine-type recombinase/integrase [Candidatus Adiutrix sp.]
MKNGRLSDVKIRAIKPAENGPAVKRYADGHGLNFVITRAGGKRWEYRFRFEGKWQTLSLGSYPLLGLAEAREMHFTAMKELKAGLNPAAEKQARKQAALEESLTLEKAALAFLEYKRENGDSVEAIKGIENRLKRHILPALGSRPLKDITAPEILEVLLAVRRLGVDETTLRCRQYIDQIFRHASRKGWIDRNPAADLRGIPELKKTGPVKHQRAVKTPADLGRLLLDIEAISGTLAGKALDLAPYVFVRAGELTGARWVEVDLSSSFWRIPAERMKMKGEHLVPLARQVKDRLAALHELTGGGPCLFPALTGGQAPMNPESLRRALNRLGYGPGALVSHTTHGFKSSASTFLRERGFDPAWIEIQLAHGERNKVVAAYNHANYIPQRQTMMQAWADYLDELREGARAESK